ncbi:hypothetical protein L484_021760 [Morus notabilis]|uniref:NADP-dependent oxidoreductase domain-containing protein n=1 Tax=Morus notabilis TaxID=981085 RepID=W9RWA1_9ROSA|nr:hypothetical protein L484_021760 [Morus notabilis]
MATVRRIKLGSQGLDVSAQGLGCMSMSAFYGAPKPEPDMIKLIHHAVDSGVTFLDTSDLYGPFTNEILLGKALKGGVREKVQLATKFGVYVHDDGQFEVKGDPAYVRAACEASLKRLDIDCIDLYYQHRIDSRVPIEVTIGELKKLVEEGKIKYIGLSEASASTIRRAHAVHPITVVQLEWSLWARDVEEEIIPTCRELGIGIVAYSPLGRGFMSSGPKIVEKMSDDDYRKTLPRFQPENLQHNQKIFEQVNEIASRKGCTPSQLALAWVYHQGNDVCPIPGTTKIENFNQNVAALSVKLTPEEKVELESLALAIRGDRFWTDFLRIGPSGHPALIPLVDRITLQLVDRSAHHWSTGGVALLCHRSTGVHKVDPMDVALSDVRGLSSSLFPGIWGGSSPPTFCATDVRLPNPTIYSGALLSCTRDNHGRCYFCVRHVQINERFCVLMPSPTIVMGLWLSAHRTVSSAQLSAQERTQGRMLGCEPHKGAWRMGC